MAFRDSTVVIVETGRTVIRAGHGLHDLLKTPTVEIAARVGIRRTATLTDTQTASTSRSTSFPQHSILGGTVADYLVGSQLEDAIAAGQDIIISWPFANGDVYDWTQAEALWKYVIFNELQRRRAQNESPVLLTIASGLSRVSYERITQIFFERFNVAGFCILERPMAQIYAANALSGIVVDIGEEWTDIAPVFDGFIVPEARSATMLGIRDCKGYLAHLLRTNQSVVAAFGSSAPIHTLQALVQHVLDQGLIRPPSSGISLPVDEDDGVTDIAAIVAAGREKAVIESGMKKKATAKASAAEQARLREIEALDLVTVKFQGHELTLGKERHRFCEPLFDPDLLRGVEVEGKTQGTEKPLPVQDVVGLAMSRVQFDMRQYVWTGLFVTGDLTKHVKGIGIALQSRLKPFILINSEVQTDTQARYIRVIGLPEFYPEYRDTGDGFAAFLGASIAAKITFSDGTGKNFVSKAEYSQQGPHAIVETTPALL